MVHLPRTDNDVQMETSTARFGGHHLERRKRTLAKRLLFTKDRPNDCKSSQHRTRTHESDIKIHPRLDLGIRKQIPSNGNENGGADLQENLSDGTRDKRSPIDMFRLLYVQKVDHFLAHRPAGGARNSKERISGLYPHKDAEHAQPEDRDARAESVESDDIQRGQVAVPIRLRDGQGNQDVCEELHRQGGKPRQVRRDTPTPAQHTKRDFVDEGPAAKEQDEHSDDDIGDEEREQRSVDGRALRRRRRPVQRRQNPFFGHRRPARAAAVAQGIVEHASIVEGRGGVAVNVALALAHWQQGCEDRRYHSHLL
ncbi:MAG: hypothetical protein M1840_001183 [Geoglossum simile]|nr:MAG: hypothetical protein M1840_001183 [Geoglossum simile]